MIKTAFAFFDFDDTLARGDSIFPYLLYCVKRGLAPKTQLFKGALGFLRWKLNPACGTVVKQETLSFIKGHSVDEMDAVARDFFREKQVFRFFQQGMQEIERLRSDGVKIVIVSASADVYMHVLAEFMPIDAVISTTCEVKDGLYTGRIGPNCKGEEKPRRIAAWLEAQGLRIDRAASAGYGDSPSDAPMLLLTDSHHLVNPKKKLRKRLPQGTIHRW